MKIPIGLRLKIEKAIEDEVVEDERRGYLGLSQIGHECPRALWYGFRFCTKSTISARASRLLKRGHREEPIIVADLQKAGVIVHSDQTEVVTGYGHIRGHIDGVGENIPDAPKTPHLLEFKTMADKYFQTLCQKGLKESNAIYFTQYQCYMRLKKLTRTLFISVNKNNDARYYERVQLEKDTADFYLKRGESIIIMEQPPERVESWKCNWCVDKPICKEGATPDKNCRTCNHCDMEGQGQWSCSKLGLKNTQVEFQLNPGCSEYSLLTCFSI